MNIINDNHSISRNIPLWVKKLSVGILLLVTLAIELFSGYGTATWLNSFAVNLADRTWVIYAITGILLFVVHGGKFSTGTIAGWKYKNIPILFFMLIFLAFFMYISIEGSYTTDKIQREDDKLELAALLPLENEISELNTTIEQLNQKIAETPGTWKKATYWMDEKNAKTAIRALKQAELAELQKQIGGNTMLNAKGENTENNLLFFTLLEIIGVLALTIGMGLISSDHRILDFREQTHSADFPNNVNGNHNSVGFHSNQFNNNNPGAEEIIKSHQLTSIQANIIRAYFRVKNSGIRYPSASQVTKNLWVMAKLQVSSQHVGQTLREYIPIIYQTYK